MNNRTLYLTLIASASISFVVTLLLHYILSGNLGPRLTYGIFVTVLAALGALVVVKLTTLFVSWRGVATVYLLLLFVMGLFIIVIQN